MITSIKNYVKKLKNAYNTITDKKFISNVIELAEMVVTKVIVEESTRKCERARCQGEVTEKNKCGSCHFYSNKRCGFSALTAKCPAGEGRYYVEARLLGTKEEYVSLQRTNEENFAEKVWEWTEKAIEEGRGKIYVAYSMGLLEEASGNSSKWRAAMKETVRFLGPDSFQLECERRKTNLIFGFWERLMKYQFDLRFPRNREERHI